MLSFGGNRDLRFNGVGFGSLFYILRMDIILIRVFIGYLLCVGYGVSVRDRVFNKVDIVFVFWEFLVLSGRWIIR